MEIDAQVDIVASTLLNSCHAQTLKALVAMWFACVPHTIVQSLETAQ